MQSSKNGIRCYRTKFKAITIYLFLFILPHLPNYIQFFYNNQTMAQDIFIFFYVR